MELNGLNIETHDMDRTWSARIHSCTASVTGVLQVPDLNDDLSLFDHSLVLQSLEACYGRTNLAELEVNSNRQISKYSYCFKMPQYTYTNADKVLDLRQEGNYIYFNSAGKGQIFIDCPYCTDGDCIEPGNFQETYISGAHT